MLGLLLTTLILAFFSLFSSFAVLLRILLPLLFAYYYPSLQRGAYGANPQKATALPRASSFGSFTPARRPSSSSACDVSEGRRGSRVDSVLGSGSSPCLRSAQRVQVWLAIVDIVATALLIAYWVSVATITNGAHPTWTTYPPSPFFNAQTAALIVLALSLRPVLLTLVSVLSLIHIRLGRSSYLGRLDWGLWTTTCLVSAALAIIAWLIFRFAPPAAASRVVTSLLLGFNTVFLVASTLALIGLMATIYQAKVAFRVAAPYGRNYSLVESPLPSPSTMQASEAPPKIELSKPATDSPKLDQLFTPALPSQHGHGIFGQRQADEGPVAVAEHGQNIISTHLEANIATDVHALLGTVTTTTGGAMSAVAGSAVPSSADPYHIAPSAAPSTQKGTTSTARSLHARALRGSSGPAEATTLTPMLEHDQEMPGFQSRPRLHSSASATSETHGFLAVTAVQDRRPSDLSLLSSGSSDERKVGMDGPSNKSRRSLREVLEDISRSVGGVNVDDWRHSLSQIRIAGSAISEDDATTLQQHSPRHSVQAEMTLPQLSEHSRDASANSSSLSPGRIRREVEEQVDRMFAEVGLSSFIKDKWRQIIPTGSLPIVRPSNQGGHSPQGLQDAAEQRERQRASVYATFQPAPFTTRDTTAAPATPTNISFIPHTYDPNFDGTFSQSGQTGDSSAPFSVTGVRCVAADRSAQVSDKSNESRTVPIFSRQPVQRSGTFGEGSPGPHQAVQLTHQLPTNAATATAKSRASRPSPLRHSFGSPGSPAQSQSLGPAAAGGLHPPFFNPGYLAPTAHQLGFVNVPASHTLPSFGSLPLPSPRSGPPGGGGGNGSRGSLLLSMPSDAASELVQAVQGGGDDALGAQSALVRIASFATLRAAVQRVEFDLSHEEDRLARDAAVGMHDAVRVRSVAIAEQNQRLAVLRQAQLQEERMSNRETHVALLRLSGHLLSLWLPFIFSLPYLLFGLIHPRAASAPFMLPFLLSLSLTLCGPLSAIQTFLIHGSGIAVLMSARRSGHPLQSNSGRSRSSPTGGDFRSSERTLLGLPSGRSSKDQLQESFSVRIDRAESRQVDDRVRSVPYRREHWNAGEVVGDRVSRPRSALLRGLSLIFETRPRLEVLPFQADPEPIQRRVRVQDRSEAERAPSTCPSTERLDAQSRPSVAASATSTVRPSRELGQGVPFARGRSYKGTGTTTSAGSGQYQLDGLSAMLLPRLVPGLSIGPDMPIADDDERTLVEEYQSFYRRYLSDLPDIFSFHSARQAFQDARRSFVRRINVRQTQARTATAWNIEATNVSTPNATGAHTDPGDETAHSFTTAAEASEAGERGVVSEVGGHGESTGSSPQGLEQPQEGGTRDVFKWKSQTAQVSPPRLPTGRSSSISIDAGKSLTSHPNVTTRSRHGRHQRESTSLPDAAPAVLAQLSDTGASKMSTSASMPIELSDRGHAQSVKGSKPLPTPPVAPVSAADTSLALSSAAPEDSQRRSLASELGMTSVRKSLGSEMGLESVGSGRQRKSLSSDFGLLLASLHEKKEEEQQSELKQQSPGSSKRLTSDSMSSTIMSEEISLSPSSRHEAVRSRSFVMHSSPPAQPIKAQLAPDVDATTSVGEEPGEDAPAADVDDDGQQVVPHQADAELEPMPTDAMLDEVIQHMDPLTLHRYLHPAIPLETLDEVTEEMTNDLTRSLDAIWLRSQRDSFLSMRRNAVFGTPVKPGFDDDELGIDTPRSLAPGQYGYAYITRRNALADVHTAKSSSGSTKVSDPPCDIEDRLGGVLSFDNSVWAPSAPAPLALSLTTASDGLPRPRTMSSATASTIGFEKEAEWVERDELTTAKSDRKQSKGKNKKSRSHTQQSDLSLLKHSSFNTAAASGSSSRSSGSSTVGAATSAVLAVVPDSPWAVVAPRGEADFTIASPQPPESLNEDPENWASVLGRVRRYEKMTQETPVKAGLRNKNDRDVARETFERPALQDKSNSQTSPIKKAWDAPTASPTKSNSSPLKRSSYPLDVMQTPSTPGQTKAASLGRKAGRGGANNIPAIHVRGPSDSSAMSFYHF